LPTKTIQLENFAQEIKAFSKATIEQQRRAVMNGVVRSVPDLVANSPVDTGQYVASWDFDVDEKRAILGNFAPHAPIIERGARPFRPPLGPLLAWAKRVLKDPSQPPDYSNEVWNLAVGTRNKIEKEGMQPRNVLENQIPMIIANIREELERGR